MEIKTKYGKYFSELGSWKGLIEAIVFVLILKVFGFTLFGILIAVIASVIMIFVIPKIFKKDESEKVSHEKYFNFSTKNWFLFSLIILLAFAIYWFGIRPVMIRKDCSIVKYTEPARPAESASGNWPKCQEVNPFNDPNNPLGSPSFNPDYCHGPRPASPEENLERKAHDTEYKTCLRESGI